MDGRRRAAGSLDLLDGNSLARLVSCLRSTPAFLFGSCATSRSVSFRLWHQRVFCLLCFEPSFWDLALGKSFWFVSFAHSVFWGFVLSKRFFYGSVSFAPSSFLVSFALSQQAAFRSAFLYLLRQGSSREGFSRSKAFSRGRFSVARLSAAVLLEDGFT